jgi:hypothetical protein
MLGATWRAGRWEAPLDRARPQLIARRLPLFAAGWLLATAVWGLILVLDARLAVFPATLLFVFQLGVLIAAIAICHHGARPARIPVVALAACVLLSLSSTSLFAAIGGYGEMLAFILLTLFLASSPLFAWSGRAAMILLFGTLVPWLLAIPFLHFFLRPFDLSAAIAIGAGVSLVVLEASKRNAKLAFKAAEQAPVPSAEPLPRPGASSLPEHGEIAFLRAPLLKLKEEEVDGLRKEVKRLWVEVNRNLAADDTEKEAPPEETVPVGQRRRRRRRSSPPAD